MQRERSSFHQHRAGSADLVDRSRSSRRAFTVLELLTVVAIVSLLFGLLLPAIASAREAARRLECTSQLKQIGLALHQYHDAYGSLPTGWQWDANRETAYGWTVPILPWLDQAGVLSSIERRHGVGHITNLPSRAITIPLLLCPSDPAELSFSLYPEPESGVDCATPIVELPTTNYVGVFGTIEADEFPIPVGDGCFLDQHATRFSELRRGLSNTLLIGERTMARVPSTWLGVDFRGEDAACRLVGSALETPNCRVCDECEFGSRHPGGTNFLWADGHVQFVSEQINHREYQTLARRSLD